MRAAALLLLLAAPAPPPPAGTAAGHVVTSAAPDAVAVTVYRDPDRGGGGALDVDWLGGFALVTERRTVLLPAGASTIRFEGVAGGIVPVSAIVSGLPGGVVEKNRDARLLSPAALIDGSLGRRVTVRRTDRASGRVSEADAIVRAGTAGGVVLETRAGIEALACSGLAEAVRYDAVPPGLSARPTLSVETRTPAAGAATVTLSYLASEFDWQANYVARIAGDGRTLDLFAWLTLANGNDEAFARAELLAVAGTLNRVGGGYPRFEPRVPPLSLRCWPQDITSTAPTIEPQEAASEIIVTAMRVAAPMMMPAPPPAPPPPPPPVAQQEGLGDLKLYRLPEPVTIAAHSQKQVTLLRRAHVPFARIHTFTVDAGTAIASRPAAIRLRMRNVAAQGLGLPLPAGSVALFEGAAGGERLVGGGRLRDTAIGEEAEIGAGSSAQVRLALAKAADGRWTARLTNANPAAVTVEVRLRTGGLALADASVALAKKDGMPVWSLRLPANGAASLSYRLAGAPAAGAAPRPARRR